MSKQSATTSSKSTKETREEAVKQTQSQQYGHQSDIIDIVLLPSHPHSAAVSIFRLQAGKRRHSRYFLAMEIKQNLRIVTVKPISHSQTKFTYSKFDTKSLESLHSHPSNPHLLILFLKSSRLFKFLIFIETICQTFETKILLNLDPICYYLQNF